MILHLRVVPGLGIAVETRARPEISARPIIMGGLPHQRGTVQEANARAQYAGVQVGMTLAQAYQHCPDGVFLSPRTGSSGDLPHYLGVWEEICALLASYTPLVEPLESGQVVADLSGHQYRWTDGWQAAYEVRRRIYDGTGILPWLGVASNRLVAQLAAAQVGADGITVIEPGQEQTFLADLPLTLFPGVDPRLALTLQVLGLITARQFAALPRAAVKQRFGAAGERLHDATRGLDPRPVTPPPARQVVAVRGACEEGTAEEGMAVLQRLTTECAAELQARQLAGKLIKLTLVWETPSRAPRLPGAIQQAVSLREERNEVGITQDKLPAPCALLPLAPDHPAAPACAPVGREETGVKSGYRIEHTLPRISRLPIPYRIHSMLPQPGNPRTEQPVATTSGLPVLAPFAPDDPAVARGAPHHPVEPFTRVGAVVRTAINSAEPLFQRAAELLRQHWPRPIEHAPRLQAIELEVSEFEQPTQLSFALLSRLDQGGGLAGMDSVRLNTLRQQEDILAARYGETSFRHLAHIDPASVLTERRFRWASGLPWAAPISSKTVRRGALWASSGRTGSSSRRPVTRRRA